MTGGAAAAAVETRIPARLDRLPWARFHLIVVIALGITWVLDGLEVTIIGAVSGVLQDPGTLHLTGRQIGTLASFYVAGAVTGALFFGWLTDRLGRKLIVYVTLAVYLTGVLLSAFSWGPWSFAAFRFITGLGIGGEYAAINSAIDELIPARLRGRVDLVVNGSFWVGAAAGAAATLVLLDTRFFSVDMGWRFGFGIGAVLGLGILLMRRWVPESPRWLVTHGRNDEAERVVGGIEAEVERETGKDSLEEAKDTLTVHPRKSFGFDLIFKAMFGKYRGRSILALSLMVAQAFAYNSVFFSYGLVLTNFFQVPGPKTGIYLLPLAVGNFMGPLLLGRLFDTVGRRKMISGTFGLAGVLLIATGWMFAQGWLTSTTQTVAWTVIFFFASAASSSAYLTASEIFPLETRALAIAVFYAVGTAIGGIAAPWLFGALIDTGSRWALFGGYLVAAALMLVAAGVELKLGVDAEGQSLEKIADPLSSG